MGISHMVLPFSTCLIVEKIHALTGHFLYLISSVKILGLISSLFNVAILPANAVSTLTNNSC